MTTTAAVEEVARIIDPEAFDDSIGLVSQARRQNAVLDKARRILALPSVGCPSGWKLVPVEPTEEMQASFFKSCDEHGMVLWRTGYRALLAAAPPPPQPVEDRP